MARIWLAADVRHLQWHFPYSAKYSVYVGYRTSYVYICFVGAAGSHSQRVVDTRHEDGSH